MPDLSAPSAKILTFRFNNRFCIRSGQSLPSSQGTSKQSFFLKNDIGGFAEGLHPVMWGQTQWLRIAMIDENSQTPPGLAAIGVTPAGFNPKTAGQLHTQYPRCPEQNAWP